MLSITEMVDKTEEQRKQIGYNLDQGFYDFEEMSLLTGQSKADREALRETLRNISLMDIVKRSGDDLPWLKPKIKEFLAKSSTTGIAGAAYLIPEKIYQIMFDSAVLADIVADISIALIPADQIPGATLKVDIAEDNSYLPKRYSSGGAMPTETIKTVQATLDFTQPWGINFRIANDLIEDSQFDLIEMHIRNAGREMGEYATNEALTVFKTATDGDGTKNSSATGDDDETKFTGGTTMDIERAMKANCDDGYPPNIMVTTHESWVNSIWSTIGSSNQTSDPWKFERVTSNFWPKTFCDMNLYFVSNPSVSALNPDGDWTECITLLGNKEYSLLSGRKRWLRIEKYSDPIRDLVGATITARQDSVTVYNDSIYILTES